MAVPIGRGELVADEPVDGRRVGHAQQRLGEAEERDPLLRGKPVFRQEHLDPAAAVAALPRLGDEAARRGGDAGLERRRQRGGRKDARVGLGLVQAIGRAHRGAQRVGLRRWSGMNPAARHPVVL